MSPCALLVVTVAVALGVWLCQLLLPEKTEDLVPSVSIALSSCGRPAFAFAFTPAFALEMPLPVAIPELAKLWFGDGDGEDSSGLPVALVSKGEGPTLFASLLL